MIPLDQDFKTNQNTPMRFPDKYALTVLDSRHHPQRIVELPVRATHRASALYMDIFVYGLVQRHCSWQCDWIDPFQQLNN